MADPKYAGLPGIAADQPDMYESTEAFEPELDEESDSESLETLHLSSLSWLEDLEVGGSPGDETILQKFQRLQCEIAELVEEVDGMTESDREEGELAGVAIQVAGLTKQLNDCQISESLTSSVQQSSSSSLTQKIDDLQSGSKAGKKASTGDQGVYEIFMKGDTAGNCSIAELDKRLAELEAAIGGEGTTKSILNTGGGRASLSRSCAVLAGRRNLLDSSHLDHVEGRLASLQYKVNNIADQKDAVEAANKSSQVGKLYQMVESTEALASVLPSVLERLEQIALLEESAGGWSSSLAGVENLQGKVEGQLEACRGLTTATEKDMVEGLKKVGEEFAKIQELVEKVKV